MTSSNKVTAVERGAWRIDYNGLFPVFAKAIAKASGSASINYQCRPQNEIKPPINNRSECHMDLLDLFRHHVGLQSLPAGHVLFNEGDAGDFMYVLISGAVEIFVRNRLMETAEAGAIVGEMAIIDDSPRSATVVAKSDCKLLPIERERFNFLVQREPEFALHVMRVMVDRLRRTDSIL